MIANARAIGRNVAADNLQRFLDGTGGTKQISVSWLQGFNAIKDAVGTNEGRFEASLKKRALEMADGKTVTFSDHWDRALTGSTTTELFYASGTSQITSTGNFSLTKTGDSVTISGSASHDWNDPYDWHAGLSAFIPGTGSVNDADALLLQQHRGASPFHMNANWVKTLSGTYNIDSFLYFDSSTFNWK